MIDIIIHDQETVVDVLCLASSCFRVSVRRPVRISAVTPSCRLDSISSTLSSMSLSIRIRLFVADLIREVRTRKSIFFSCSSTQSAPPDVLLQILLLPLIYSCFRYVSCAWFLYRFLDAMLKIFPQCLEISFICLYL